MAVAENDTIAQLYAPRVRTYAKELSKIREREAGIIKILQEEDRRIKRDGPRERGVAQTFGLSTWKPNKGHKGRDKDKGEGKGKDKKGGGRAKAPPRTVDGRRIPAGKTRQPTGETAGGTPGGRGAHKSKLAKDLPTNNPRGNWRMPRTRRKRSNLIFTIP